MNKRKWLNEIKKLLFSGYVVLVLFIIALFFLYRRYLKNLPDAFKGAFWGAFFAIIVGIVIFYVKQRILLQGRRYNVLVYFEMKLNTLLFTLNDNQSLIEQGVNIKGIFIMFPHELTINEDRIHEMGRITIKNELMGLSLSLGRYNNSLKTTIAAFQKDLQILEGNLLEWTPDRKKEFLNHAKNDFKQRLSKIGTFGNELIDKIKDILVEVRFFVKNDKSRFLPTIWQKYYDKKELKSCKMEDRKRLEKEIESIRIKDKESKIKFGISSS